VPKKRNKDGGRKRRRFETARLDLREVNKLEGVKNIKHSRSASRCREKKRSSPAKGGRLENVGRGTKRPSGRNGRKEGSRV